MEKAPKTLEEVSDKVQLIVADQHYCFNVELEEFKDAKDPAAAQRKHIIK